MYLATWSGLVSNKVTAGFGFVGTLLCRWSKSAVLFGAIPILKNMIVMSSFHLSSEAIPSYLKAMEDYGVDIIQAYPSSIATLAKYLESVDQYYQGRLKSIMTSSEALSQEDRPNY